MSQRIASLTAALLLATGLGCTHSTLADPTGRLSALEEAQSRYTQLVRWGELKRAAAYVEPEMVAEFLSYQPLLDQIRITDTDADEVKLDPSQDSATVGVVYHAYSYNSFQERKIYETQEWKRYDGMSNVWLVRPQIEEIAAAFQAGAR